MTSADRYIPVSSKLRRKITGHLYYECPACGVPHGLRIVPKDYKKVDPNEQVWTWNDDVDHPTFHPSVLVRFHFGAKRTQRICHAWVKDGMITYLDDCTHSLKGQTVPIPLWDTID